MITMSDFATEQLKTKTVMEEQLFNVMQGWQCPICKRVYSPFTRMCIYCSNKEVKTVTLPNTGGFAQEQKSDFRNQTIVNENEP